MLGTVVNLLIVVALPHELGRYRGKADVAFVASCGRVYGYTA
jgi:hypothetical protein